jgi:ATP-binding cassette, subfamily F, member 3
MRINLAQALMTRSDLLLLDEPTNHLDMDAVLWLEGWLTRYPGMLLMITHDRDFLDAVAQHILHMDGNCGATLYSGNYSAFELQRGERLVLQQAAFEKQQRQVKHLEAFITRFRAKATKAKQAQSRIKALEKMERIAAAHVDSPFTFAFRKPFGEPRMLLRMEHASLGYGEKTVLKDVNFSVLPQSRIGLLGRNGEGKSTLMKALAGDLALQAGLRHEGHHLKIGYFAQHQLDILRMDENALWHMMKCDAAEAEYFNRGLAREQELRDFLGSFDFRGDRLNDPVRIFSGGEKARLALALIVWQKPNLLLLDEPTNHLDIEMRHALTEALLDYEGSLIVVTHDRHLLRATCDEMIWVHNGRAEPFDGDLDDYRDSVKIAPQVSTAPAADSDTAKRDRRETRKEDAAERNRLNKLRKPLQHEILKIEKRLATLNAERSPITAWITSEAAYAIENRDLLAQQTQRDGEIASEVGELELEWLDVTEKMEWIR